MKQKLQAETDLEAYESNYSEDGKKHRGKSSSRKRRSSSRRNRSRDSDTGKSDTGKSDTGKSDTGKSNGTNSSSEPATERSSLTLDTISLKSSSSGKKKRRSKKKKSSSKRYASSPLLQEYLEVKSTHESSSIASSLSGDDDDDGFSSPGGTENNKSRQGPNNKIEWKDSSQYQSPPTQFITKELTVDNNTSENHQPKTSSSSDQATIVNEANSIPGMNLSDVLEIRLDCIEIDLITARCLWTIGVSLESYSSFLQASDTAAGTAVAKRMIKFIMLSLTTFSNCTHVLSYLLSEDLDEVDEEDLLDVGYTGTLKPSLLIKKLTSDRIQARIWMEKLRVLSADSWYTLGQCSKSFVEKTWLTAEDVLKLGLIDKDQSVNPVRVCFENALTLLTNSSLLSENAKRNKKLPSLGMLFHASMRHVLNHLMLLKYNVWHALGVLFIEQEQDNDSNNRALKCFQQSINGRRKLLKRLQDKDDESSLKRLEEDFSMGSGNTYLSSASYGTSTKKESKDGLFLSLENIIPTIETTLSSSLEYAALCHHSQGHYDESLSLFQDALILRALYQGKSSLQVASLQYNMGVVNDDLGQHEASLGRYGESLRIRLLHENEETRSSIILTLRCMKKHLKKNLN